MLEPKPLASLGKAVAVLLGLNALWDIAALGSGALQMSLIERMQRGDFTQAEAEANDLREQLIGLSGMALYLLTAIVFLVWFYRAYANVEALGHTRERTSGWAIGVWFVPFASLVWPYQMTQEIFRKSMPEDDEDLSFGVVPGVVLVWWGFWIVDNILGQVVFRIGTDTLAELETATFVAMLHNAIGIGSAVCAALVVRALTAQQERGLSALRGETEPAVF
ncbi:MAG: DUF4328 domain-containing protein [Sandaracinaceae bacterium]